jgi:hypothetical protein
MMPACPYCSEAIQPGEPTQSISHNGQPCEFHVECTVRMVAGSVEHQLGKCSCYGGSEVEPALSLRELARRAYKVFQETTGGRARCDEGRAAKWRWN